MTPPRLAAVLCLALAAAPGRADDSPTYRGNPQRTGGDGKAGPSAPRVLWAMKAKDHFIASPVVLGDRLFVSGQSYVNSSDFYCLDTAAQAAKRVRWVQRSPLLQLPTVSSPAVFGDKVVFGDGMHQTNGASLYCLGRDAGAPLWRLEVPGALVHLEGSPTAANGKIYLGGGAAGVLCIDPARVKVGGKEMSQAEGVRLLETRRALLQKKYEEARKKKDPFAVPPSDKDLALPSPVLVWQQGKERWHVDAPVAVVGGKVLAASAYLDKEKVGTRALFCLDAKTGRELWTAPLAINPWGGPSVQGNRVVVSGSTASLDPAALKGARGVVAAFDLDTGKQAWKKTLPGGVVSCVALSADLAVATCTDGKVRAYALARGGLRWTYAGGAAFFAPVALGPDAAYAADLDGVVHAIDLKKGVLKWKLDLPREPAVAAPGMVYAGPTLRGRRLYVVTCNIAGRHANGATVAACLGDK